MHAWVSAAVLAWGLSIAPPDAPALVRQLGSDEFAEREAASRKLAALGQAAVDALRHGLKSDDPEVRSRAARLLQSITTKGQREETRVLQGSWKLQYVGERGRGMVVEGNNALGITFAGDRYTLIGRGFVGLVDMSGPYRLGRQQEVKTIDLTADGRAALLAIYELEDDSTLRICLDLTQDRHRPEKLAAGARGQPMLLTFKRAAR